MIFDQSLSIELLLVIVISLNKFPDLDSNPCENVDDQREESEKENRKILLDRNRFVRRELSDANVEVDRVLAGHHDVDHLRDDGEAHDPQVEKDLPEIIL